MVHGPVEMMALTFTGDTVGAGVADALADVVARGDVTILDLVFLAKDDGGEVRIIEAEESDGSFGLADLDVDPSSLLNDEDLELVAEDLQPGTAAAFIVFEHTWARRVTAAARDAGGEIALHVRIPGQTVDEVMSALA